MGWAAVAKPARGAPCRVTLAFHRGKKVAFVVLGISPHLLINVQTCKLHPPIQGKLFPPSQKEYKSHFPRSEILLILTKFIQKITNICVSESM